MLLNKSVMLSLLFTIVLSGCSGNDGFGLGNGGGNSSDPDTTPAEEGGDNTTSVNPKLGSGSGTSFSSGVLTTNIANGTVLSYGGGVVITVNLVDASSSNALISTPSSITFTSGCVAEGLATIGTTAITSAGTATVNYIATSCSGSDTIVATLGSNTSETASVTFGISNLDLGTGRDGTFVSGGLTTSVGEADLSYGGDTVVSVNLVDSSENSLFTSSSVTVNFTSGCVQTGKSTIDASVNTTTGTAVATYSANTCEGADTIIANLSDGTSASKLITVAGQVLGALEFVSASPTTIALSGSGSSANPEVSTVSFSLKDKTGAPIAGETVSYTLSTNVGRISLSSNSSVTNASGVTSVQLNAGGVNVSVVVVATVVIINSDGSTSTTTTTSGPIAILGGIPDQNSFSLSVEVLNPEGWDQFGVTNRISIRAADRYNNLARDGTQISFVTNGGSIVGACALAGGSCSVNWVSQFPRPADGIVSVLARTTGEESFTDTNSNGKYDVGETVLTNLPEAFLDIDRSGTRNSDDEFFSDFNDNGVYDTKAGTLFQGTNCSAAAKAAGHCASLVDVRASGIFCMSTNDVEVRVDTLIDTDVSIVDVSTGQQTLNLIFSDANGNSPPRGTTFDVSLENGEIVFGGDIALPNGCDPGNGFQTNLIVKADEDNATVTGLLTIEIIQVNGVVRPIFIELCHLGVSGGSCRLTP
jgi:hypothetical protein